MDPSRDTVGVVRCGLLAHAFTRLSAEAAASMRRAPLRACGEAFAVSSLKHFDEQTLAVLAALQTALRSVEWSPETFRDWGVLAAPRFLGRSQMVPSMARFHVEGAWGVSPHMVPYRSLHSISGTVSQFLKIHGPNYGVGGGHGGVEELLAAGMALLADRRVPGLWLVACRVEPDDGLHPSPSEAIALALLPEASAAPRTFEYVPGAAIGFDALAEKLGETAHAR